MNAIFQHLERLTRDRFWELAAWELWKQRAAGVWWAWVVPHPFRLPCRTQSYCREPALAEDCISWSPVVLQFCDSVSLSWAVPVTTATFGKEEKLYCIFVFSEKGNFAGWGEGANTMLSAGLFSFRSLWDDTADAVSCFAVHLGCAGASLMHIWLQPQRNCCCTSVVMFSECFCYHSHHHIVVLECWLVLKMLVGSLSQNKLWANLVELGFCTEGEEEEQHLLGKPKITIIKKNPRETHNQRFFPFFLLSWITYKIFSAVMGRVCGCFIYYCYAKKYCGGWVFWMLERQNNHLDWLTKVFCCSWKDIKA